MHWVFAPVGLVVLGIVILDILWTTLWVDGGSGPLSSRLTTGVWRGLRRLSSQDDRLLSAAGPLILTLTLVQWIALLWLGWTFLFAADQTSLISTHTGEPADWTGHLYYVAYTMFTNGNGDYMPTSGTWEIASSFTTATGMAFVTLGISYVLTVLGAVTQKRSFASDIMGLGTSPEAFIEAGWNGETFDGLELPLESVATQLSELAAKHKAYPILHYYHSEQAERAAAMAVPVLDDALLVLEHAVDPADQPDPVLLTRARSSTDSYLDTLETAFIDPAAETPPHPSLETVRTAGVPTKDDGSYERAVRETEARRRKLLGVVRADAWRWPTGSLDRDRDRDGHDLAA